MAIQLATPPPATTDASAVTTPSHHGRMVFIRNGAKNLRPLVILPGGDGGQGELLVFASIVRYLPGRQSVIGMDLHLGNPRYPLENSIHALVEGLYRELHDLTNGNGFDLLGECHTGPLALALAGYARASGQADGKLILFDSIKPQPRTWLDRLLGRPAATQIQRPVTPPAEENTSDSAYLLSQRRKYLAMLRNYQNSPVDIHVDLVCCSAWQATQSDAMGWDAVTSSHMRHIVEGNHNSYIRENAATTAACLAKILGQ